MHRMHKLEGDLSVSRKESKLKNLSFHAAIDTLTRARIADGKSLEIDVHPVHVRAWNFTCIVHHNPLSKSWDVDASVTFTR